MAEELRERRRGPRAPTRVPVRVTVEVSDIDACGLRFATSLDLSVVGMFLCDPEPSPVGTSLDLVFDLPGAANLSVQAVVRRVVRSGESEPGMGVEFASLGQRESDAIAAYVAANAPTDAGANPASRS